jgi:hypothetical protein
MQMRTPDRAYQVNRRITPGTPVPAGRGVFIACSVAGNVALRLSGGTTLVVPVTVGPNWIDRLEVVDVVAGQTTATADVDTLS